jgi:hypothetical protein
VSNTNVSWTNGGSLPTNVNYTTNSNTRTVSGTPAATGTYNFTVTATSSNGCAVTKSGSIAVSTKADYATCASNTECTSEKCYCSHCFAQQTYCKNNYYYYSVSTSSSGTCSAGWQKITGESLCPILLSELELLASCSAPNDAGNRTRTTTRCTTSGGVTTVNSTVGACTSQSTYPSRCVRTL